MVIYESFDILRNGFDAAQRVGHLESRKQHHHGGNPARKDRRRHLLRHAFSGAQHGHARGWGRADLFPRGVQHDHRAGALGAAAKGQSTG